MRLGYQGRLLGGSVCGITKLSRLKHLLWESSGVRNKLAHEHDGQKWESSVPGDRSLKQGIQGLERCIRLGLSTKAMAFSPTRFKASLRKGLDPTCGPGVGKVITEAAVF